MNFEAEQEQFSMDCANKCEPTEVEVLASVQSRSEEERVARIKAFFDSEFDRPYCPSKVTQESPAVAKKHQWFISVSRNKYNLSINNNNVFSDIQANLAVTSGHEAWDGQVSKSFTKVHIRHLPNQMSKAQFLEALGPLPPHNYLHFTNSSFMSSVLGNRAATGFCYINFIYSEDAQSFAQHFSQFKLRRETERHEFLATTVFASNQEIPPANARTQIPASDSNLFDFENCEGFRNFKLDYEAHNGLIGTTVQVPGKSVTPEVMLKEINERKKLQQFCGSFHRVDKNKGRTTFRII